LSYSFHLRFSFCDGLYPLHITRLLRIESSVVMSS
jgi:hypothetical protein